MIPVILLGTFLVLFYFFLVKPQLYWWNRNVKQGLPVPFFGDQWRFYFRRESLNDFFKRLYVRFPGERYSGIYQSILPSLIINDPELIKTIAIKDFDYFTDHRNFTPAQLDPIWQAHLFALQGDEWRRMRAMISPTFTSSKMKSMFPLMNDIGKQVVTFYTKQKLPLIEVEGKDLSTRFANDIVATCAFGITCNSLVNPNNDFYTKGHEIGDISGFWKSIKFFINFVSPKVAGFFNLSFFPADIGDYFKAIIKETVQYREKHNIVRPDFVNLLMETAKTTPMSVTDMAAQALVFFFAGFDTVSNLMAFMLYELAVNQEVQERLRQEIDQSIEATNGVLTYETLHGLKYLDMVISEALRMYPPVIATDRMCSKPYTIQPTKPNEKPVKLEVGDMVWFPAISLQFDPEYYPEPHRFDPERFSEENKEKIVPYTYLPFGTGPRNCIGSRFALMEVKVLFYHLISKFEFHVIDKTPIPAVLKMGAVTPQLAGDYWVGFKNRELM